MSHSQLLIDSHVLVWLLYEPEKINNNAQTLLQTADEVYLSVVSMWELALKFSKHKLAYKPEELIKGAQELNLSTLPLRDEHIIALPKIRLAHKDPFDTLLIAQAKTEGCRFLTADNYVLASKYDTFSAGV